MQLPRLITLLSILLFSLAIAFLTAACYLWIQNRQFSLVHEPSTKKVHLPKRTFALPDEQYAMHVTDSPFIALQSAPPSLQVPDLRQQLLYFGKNGRPDAEQSKSKLHLSFMGSKQFASVSPKEKIFLIYDKKSTPPRYTFSPNNQETSLWIIVEPIEQEISVSVTMSNEHGEPIEEPAAYAKFRIPEREYMKQGNLAAWEIAGQRVDATLLARQRARWYGIDFFLEKQGGEEFKFTHGKHRIDFGEGEEIYSVFVELNDCLVWNKDRWWVTHPSSDTVQLPLLVIKKMDDRLLTGELWDPDGKGKITLNMLKSTEPWVTHGPQNIQQSFKFLGARTHSQCVFEINQERVLLSPSDWLLFTGKEWKKLDSAEEIDQYVKRKLIGLLFVFEGLQRKDERQMITGILYNNSRTDYQVIEIPTQPGGQAKVLGKEEDRNSDGSSSETSSESTDSEQQSHEHPPVIPLPH